MKRSLKRTDRVKYVDPVTGLTEYRYVEKVTYRYEDEEKAKAYDKINASTLQHYWWLGNDILKK